MKRKPIEMIFIQKTIKWGGYGDKQIITKFLICRIKSSIWPNKVKIIWMINKINRRFL